MPDAAQGHHIKEYVPNRPKEAGNKYPAAPTRSSRIPIGLSFDSAIHTKGSGCKSTISYAPCGRLLCMDGRGERKHHLKLSKTYLPGTTISITTPFIVEHADAYRSGDRVIKITTDCKKHGDALHRTHFRYVGMVHDDKKEMWNTPAGRCASPKLVLRPQQQRVGALAHQRSAPHLQRVTMRSVEITLWLASFLLAFRAPAQVGVKLGAGAPNYRCIAQDPRGPLHSSAQLTNRSVSVRHTSRSSQSEPRPVTTTSSRITI